MAEHTLVVLADGEEKKAAVQSGQVLLAALRDMGLYLPAICGGSGTCGKCKIRLAGGRLEPTRADREYFDKAQLEAGMRLACTARIGGDIVIELPSSGEESILAVTGYGDRQTAQPSLRAEWRAFENGKRPYTEDVRAGYTGALGAALTARCAALAAGGAKGAHVVYDGDRPVYLSAAPEEVYGIGVDIGTTTLGFELVNLLSGEVLGRRSAVNRQRRYGADVISRIVKAGEGHLDAMRDSIRTQVAEEAQAICGAFGVQPGQVVKMAIAANTTMLHLLLGLACGTLGTFPFKPVTLDGMTLDYQSLFGGGLSCPVDILPGISAYVGADITAGILFTGLHRAEKPALLLDIGTNGEMALAHKGGILCTSTAAGPAFEGGNITCGTGSVPGAISVVRAGAGGYEVDTIGGAPPIGICGSGVLDTVYLLLSTGVIDETGAFAGDADEVALARADDGQAIRFTQKDVREMQLGKSAIRSGIDILLDKAGLCYDDVGVVYLAGGFGYHLSLEAAVGIGMLPQAFLNKTVAMGNTSLGGVVQAMLSGALAGAVPGIASSADEFGLSEDRRFNDLFVENMLFEA